MTKKTSVKEVIDFMYIRLPILKGWGELLHYLIVTIVKNSRKRNFYEKKNFGRLVHHVKRKLTKKWFMTTRGQSWSQTWWISFFLILINYHLYQYKLTKSKFFY